jgi:hypothetical protein
MDLVIGGEKTHDIDPIEYLKQTNRNFILIDKDPNLKKQKTSTKKANILCKEA